MERVDKDLAFMLKFENVAWFENGCVKILDRRIYPREINYVICETYKDVITAIQNMVTQSGGPYLAASMAMVLAAHQSSSLSKKEVIAFMEKAAFDIAHARPTTSVRMETIANNALEIVKNENWNSNAELVKLLNDFAIADVTKRYKMLRKIGYQLADKVPQGGTIMTQCFAEVVIGMICEKLKKNNNLDAKFICPETRPYLQGARLTASVIKDMGFEVHVITDNMPGYIIKEKKVDLFTSASDMITMDGHVVNKVGTFQIALMCNYYGIPYFATGAPNKQHAKIDSVEIEERDPNEVLEVLGTRMTLDGVKAYYPVFDITPPSLCSGVITDKGIFSPFDLENYYK